MQLFYFECASCGASCERTSHRARFCSGRCRTRAFRLRETRALALQRQQTAALLRGDTHAALQLARSAVIGE